MLRHVVLFRWVDGIEPAQIDAIAAGLRDLPASIPAIRAYDVGPAVGGTHDFAVVADFDDEAGWRAYDEHPDHERVRRDLILPLVADRAVVRYET